MKRRAWGLAALALVAVVGLTSLTTARAEAPYTTWAIGPGYDLYMTQDAYTPLAEIDLPIDGAEDFFVAPDGALYIADTGNGQIVKLQDFEVVATYGADILEGPTGLFVDEAGTMYIADAKQGTIVILDAAGQLVTEFGRPVEPLFGRNREFLPRKITVDARRNLYIISEGSVNGIVQMNTSGNFLGYFGANASTMSLKMILQRLFLTAEQLDQFIKNEAASPTNITIDQQSLVYTVTGDNVGANIIKRFTISGRNIFPDTWASNSFRDLHVSDTGLILAVDADGFIFEYDLNGTLLFVFGAEDSGDQRLGTLRNPTAIERSGEYIYVLDKDKNAIVVYQTTAFAQTVHAGIQLYVDGFYGDAKPYFEQVLKYNGSFIMSYQAIADAYFKDGDYANALTAYRYAGDQAGYSQAYWELRNVVLQQYLGAALSWGVGAWLALAVLTRLERRRHWLDPLRRGWERVRGLKLVDDFLFLFRFIKQPADSFYYLKHNERGSLLFAGLIYAWVLVVWVASLYLTGFAFNENAILAYIRVENEVVTVVVALALWNAANYLVSTISDGEGRVRDVVIGSAYSLFPYVLFALPIALVSNVLTYNETFLYNFALGLMWSWVGLMLFLMVKEIHNYSFSETVRNVLLTLFTMALFLLTAYILYVLFSQLFDFISAILQEVGLRA